MKKIYIKPALHIVELHESHHLLAGSPKSIQSLVNTEEGLILEDELDEEDV